VYKPAPPRQRLLLITMLAKLREVCVVAAARTPIGGFNGSLASLPAPALGAAAIKGALAKAKLSATAVDECWMGNVLSAGMGQAPARQAARLAELPDATICTTVNKVCSSGMKAIALGAQQIALGQAECVVAGGFESMSNVPYIVPKARFGARMGDVKMVDTMVADGLWDPYGNCHMGEISRDPAPSCTPRDLPPEATSPEISLSRCTRSIPRFMRDASELQPERCDGTPRRVRRALRRHARHHARGPGASKLCRLTVTARHTVPAHKLELSRVTGGKLVV